MAARRSGPFSRRRKDRNRDSIRDNEEGKIQEERPDDNKFERFTGIFSREDSVRESSRENKGKGARRDGKIKEEESEDPKSGPEERGRESEGRRARRVYRLPSPLPKVPTESHSPLGLQANPSCELSRAFVASLIFRLFPKKATTLPVCDSEICRRSNLRGHRVGRMRQNCRNDDEFPRGTTGFIQGFE